RSAPRASANDRHPPHRPGVHMTRTHFSTARDALRRSAVSLAAAATLALSATHAKAHPSVSDASALSALPIVVSVAAPVAVLSAGAALTVVSVEATSTGAVWV